MTRTAVLAVFMFTCFAVSGGQEEAIQEGDAGGGNAWNIPSPFDASLEPPRRVVNVAKEAMLSSTMGMDEKTGSQGCKAGNAVDGKASGVYHVNCRLMAVSEVEASPSIR